MQKRCLNCDWAIHSVEATQREEQSRETIEHFTETGHTIVTMPEPINPGVPS
ncbi:hypothetical protein [Natronococcus occultus]|uniref:Uncharacterized protein n=1 Tax=Natronococcus occultus SP4 TaxID=694430 RepID=L0K4M5_9EURY|nr:hypothetical protein [Natronococcus occultus]AGB39971.1 hypothetical protein Natoc_4279 [Natronococcus occultus SP4]